MATASAAQVSEEEQLMAVIEQLEEKKRLSGRLGRKDRQHLAFLRDALDKIPFVRPKHTSSLEARNGGVYSGMLL